MTTTPMSMLRRLGIATAFIAIAIAVVVASVAALLANLDAPRIEREINRTLLAPKQRTLKIEGPLTLGFRHGLGIRVDRVSLSEHASPAVFARLDSAQLSLQWLPLLSRRIVIDAIELNGLAIAVERDKNGRLNFADLLESEAGSQWTFDIGDIHLAQGQLVWRDQTRAQELALDELTLNTGRIANEGEPSQGTLEIAGRLRSARGPQADGRLSIAAHYDLDLALRHYAASQVGIRFNGRLDDTAAAELNLKLDAIEVPGKQPAADAAIRGLTLNALVPPLTLSLDAPQLQLAGGMLRSAPLALGFAAASGGAVKLSGRMQARLVADFAARTATLDGIAAELYIAAPDKLRQPLKIALHGRADADLARTTASADLNGELDASRLTAQFWVTRFAPPAVRFGLDIDRIDAGRYLMPAPTKGAGKRDTDARIVAPGQLELEGRLNIGAMQVAGVKARRLRLAVSTRAGQWNVAAEPR